MVRTTVTVTEESLNALQDALLQTKVGHDRAVQIAAIRLRNYLLAVVLTALLSIFLWMLVPRCLALPMAVFTAIFLVLAFPLYRWYAFRVVRRNQAKSVRAALDEQRKLGSETLTYEFDSTGAQISCAFSTVRLPWSSMLGWMAADPYLFIVRRDNKGLIVDTRTLAKDDLQELQGYLASVDVSQLR